jgi:enoyl-CoA hydratase
MPQVFAALDRDPAVRAVIIRGQGKTFSTGLDLIAVGPTLLPLTTGGAAERAEIFTVGQQMQQAFNAVVACKKPVIAAIDGWCIGGAVELACACDLRVATARAKFSLREVKLSIVPDLGGTQRLPYIVGEGYAREMALTGADYGAADVQRMGFLNAVLDTPEQLLAHAHGLAIQIADNPPLAVAAVKHVLNARTAASVLATLREALLLNGTIMQSQDFKEAVAAIVEQRPAKFVGT